MTEHRCVVAHIFSTPSVSLLQPSVLQVCSQVLPPWLGLMSHHCWGQHLRTETQYRYLFAIR